MDLFVPDVSYPFLVLLDFVFGNGVGIVGIVLGRGLLFKMFKSKRE